MKKEGKMKDFKDLDAWKEGHELVLEIYKYTENFPQKEIYGLCSQMRRAVVSITSNIAEGFGRESIKEKIKFYYVAQASNVELQNQLEVAKDVGYIKADIHKKLLNQAITTHKIITGLIKSTRKRL